MPHKKDPPPPPSEDAQTNTRSRFARLVQRDEHIVRFVDATVVVVVCRVSCRGSIVFFFIDDINGRSQNPRS